MSNDLASTALLGAPDVAGPLRRKTASSAGRFPCGVQPVDTGNRQSGAGKETLDVSYLSPSFRGHRRQTVKPHTAGLEAKIAPGNFSNKDRWQGKRLRV
jgi:hypothetical protein